LSVTANAPATEDGRDAVNVKTFALLIPVALDDHGHPYCPNVCCDAVMEPLDGDQYRCPECAPVGEAIAQRMAEAHGTAEDGTA